MKSLALGTALLVAQAAGLTAQTPKPDAVYEAGEIGDFRSVIW
jgi:hypothetical protein